MIGPVPFRVILGVLAVVSACLTVGVFVSLLVVDVSVAVPVYAEVKSMVRWDASVVCVYSSDPVPPMGKMALRAGFGFWL